MTPTPALWKLMVLAIVLSCLMFASGMVVGKKLALDEYVTNPPIRVCPEVKGKQPVATSNTVHGQYCTYVRVLGKERIRRKI